MSIKKKTIMPPELLAGLAQGIATIGGSLVQGETNRAQMVYNQEQYDRQRKDALADWTMQNEYNSPKAQMARYKDAGLNPNLIYGQMTNSPAIRSSDMPNAHLAPANPTGAIAEGLQRYQETALQRAQVDNLKKQNDVLTQDILLKTADVLGKDYANKKMKFELDKQPELFQNTLEGIKANTRKTLMDTITSNDSNMRAWALHEGNLKNQSKTLEGMIQNIANQKVLQAKTSAERKEVLQRVQNLKRSGIIQKLDIELKKKGIQPHDAPWLRIPSLILSSEPAKKVYNRIWEGIKRSGVPGR